jgi:NADH-quinone oxidoreductase subunit L
MFHVMTHAFFKALLFLGAGSVIHGMGGIQDIRQMGGLRREMPRTFWTFLIGTIAIAGIPPFAGFFSKDAVLWAAWSSPNYGKVLWTLGVIAAGFTSFYMFRLLILTFFGKARYSHHDVHVHESPASMTVPLMLLAVCSIVAGWIGIPAALGGGNQIETFLAPPSYASIATQNEVQGALAEQPEGEFAEHEDTSTEVGLMAASTAVALLGLALAYLLYVARPELPARIAAGAHAMYGLLLNKYYIDEIYNAAIVLPILRSSREFLWKFVDGVMIDGAVNGIGWLVRASAGGLRHMQTGYVRTYVGWIVFGGILVMAWFLR